MTTYELYLESGPRHKTTMVHVLALLGCFCRRGTTAEALEATPAAIREYLRFLRRHGEDVPPPDAPFDVEVIEHVTQGKWMGHGSVSFMFQAERAPLDKAEMEKYLGWLDWSHQELIFLVEGLRAEQLDAPFEGGRTIREILHHVWESERWYVKQIAPFPTLPRGQDILTRLGWVHVSAVEVLRNLSPEVRNRIVYGRGPFEKEATAPWNARKVLRRMQEHRWEHILEIRERLTQKG